MQNYNKKIISLSLLKKIVKKLKKNKKKIVFTNGCFDILHIGHIKYLKKARKFGDCLILGLNSDSSVKKLKGAARPIFNQKQRAEVLSVLPFIDYLVIFKEDTPENLIKIIAPDLQVKGGDYKLNEIKEKSLVESLGGKVKIVKVEKGFSTTEIIHKIRNANVKTGLRAHKP